MPERILQLTPGSISQQWYEDGVAVDPGTVTIGITRADGTVVVAPATATTGSGTGARSFALTTTHTALVDHLTATWTSSAKGTLKSYIEVVGGFLFALSDLNALLQSPTSFTAAQKIEARTWVEQRLEGAIGKAYVPRYAYETVSTPRSGIVQLSGRPLRALRSIERRSGATWTLEPSLTRYDFGFTDVSGFYTSGQRNARIGYEYGDDYPPQFVSDAAALWAKVRLVSGPIDDRELQRFIGDTGAVVNLATPGRNSWSGIPDVDAVIDAEREPLIA